MGYAIAADAVVVVHFSFVLLAVAGGLLAVRWRWFPWLQLPAALWAAVVEWQGWVCPLTPLESQLRVAAGRAGYSGDFLARYLLPLLYPAGLSRRLQCVLAVLVILVNVGVYAWLLRRARHPVSSA